MTRGKQVWKSPRNVEVLSVKNEDSLEHSDSRTVKRNAKDDRHDATNRTDFTSINFKDFFFSIKILDLSFVFATGIESNSCLPQGQKLLQLHSSERTRHDYRGVLAVLNDDQIGTIQELESLKRPVRIRLDGLKDPKKRSKY